MFRRKFDPLIRSEINSVNDTPSNKFFVHRGTSFRLKISSVGQIPITANFDRYENNIVFAWGTTCVLKTDTNLARYELEIDIIDHKLNKCYDAKFSPDGKTVAVAVGNMIKFIDVNTRNWLDKCFTMPDDCHVHHLSYSKDGLTLAGVTAKPKHQLIVWDMD
jgi:WD40 repeat protein